MPNSVNRVTKKLPNVRKGRTQRNPEMVRHNYIFNKFNPKFTMIRVLKQISI